MIEIRRILEKDAENYLQFLEQLSNENGFMMVEPGERKTSIEEQIKHIERINSGNDEIIYLAVDKDKPVGFILAERGTYRRNKHSAYIVIGILKAYCGQGIGKKLFTQLECWAKDNKIHRLELTVMAHNENAIKLYEKVGFETEGIKKDSLLVSGNYVDEYYMAKVL